jgi:hypothetical protein
MRLAAGVCCAYRYATRQLALKENAYEVAICPTAQRRALSPKGHSHRPASFLDSNMQGC